jgi:FlaA1/EpsC-like NDP-sugar epimerase
MTDQLRNGFRNRHLLLLDLALLPLATLLAYILRFEGLAWPEGYAAGAAIYLTASLAVKLVTLYFFGLYRRLWRFASVSELETILLATFVSGSVSFILGVWLLPAAGLTVSRVPLSVLGLDVLLTAGAVAVPRLLVRSFRWHQDHQGPQGEHQEERKVLIAGAGHAGVMLLRQLQISRLGLIPIGFVDDDKAKQNHELSGLPVLGSLAETTRICQDHGVSEVLIAMPTAPGRVLREVVRSAAGAGVSTRTLPGISDILSGRFDPFALRQVEIQDLLRRDPVRIDLTQVQGLATGRTVLVTGAGGSIGSELCRQLCGLEPKRLVLLGHGENSIFSIQQELHHHFPQLPVHAVIADVKSPAQLARVFEQYRPTTVFHAAAHKHVPLMEENLAEAILNNVLGTRNVAEAAAESDVEHLVLISTDKAVRPTSVMGATKRIAEQILQAVAEDHDLNFVAVRFGNVLGSRGSVVPTFLKQIAAGGPVTVTHPEMRRYFMTIPEAVQLVLQAGAMGRGGEVFVLDMGEPVKIADLAADLIRLSGKTVGKDIEIRFSGTRPGEKLYEELFFDAEHATPTDHPKVLRARNATLPVGVSTVVNDLVQAAHEGWPADELRTLLRRLVPDYEPSLAGMPVKHDAPARKRDSGGARLPEE